MPAALVRDRCFPFGDESSGFTKIAQTDEPDVAGIVCIFVYGRQAGRGKESIKVLEYESAPR